MERMIRACAVLPMPPSWIAFLLRSALCFACALCFHLSLYFSRACGSWRRFNFLAMLATCNRHVKISPKFAIVKSNRNPKSKHDTTYYLAHVCN